MSKSILTIPKGLFGNWPIIYSGNILNPIFDSASIVNIVGGTIEGETIDEISLYGFLGLMNNEFSCKLFCLIVERLNTVRLTVVNETNQISPFNEIANDLKNMCRLASLMLKKHKNILAQEDFIASEDRELSHLMSELRIQ